MMIEFYDLIINMGYTPEIETLRNTTFSGQDLKSAFCEALSSHNYNLRQAKKLVLDLCFNRDTVRLNFLLGYRDEGVMNYILEIANKHREFYPLTRKLINQYLYNLTEDITYSYIEFYQDNVVRYLFLPDEADKFIAMVRESPILKHIYYVDAGSKVRSPGFGVAKSNLLLQSEVFKYETAEMFSKLRDLGRADIGQMDMIEIPYEGNVMRAIRKDEAWRALKAANFL
uniref:hypothetical protein n=1 Tax=Fusarium aethiopicum TaxID=569394 RepID=UPI002029403F|nr:hypothetical protein NDA35_mgp32 [Fusarium aethiopicum]UPX01178.1 hypothetical protein [Fusarium aethiopicum]UPX01235.1 hypothetical protein [Fusarium aethiopicum]